MRNMFEVNNKDTRMTLSQIMKIRWEMTEQFIVIEQIFLSKKKNLYFNSFLKNNSKPISVQLNILI